MKQSIAIGVLAILTAGQAGYIIFQHIGRSDRAARISPPPIASPSLNPNSQIGLVGEDGFEIKVDPPDLPECKSETARIDQALFDRCLTPGLTSTQVGNLIGFRGKTIAQTTSMSTVVWQDGVKTIGITFDRGYLLTKSGAGL